MKNKKAKYIGIDVGGTKILLQTFDAKLNPVDQIKVHTETKKGQKGFINQLYKLIDDYFCENVIGIGIAVPGIVDINKGLLVKAPHLPTDKNCPLVKLIKSRYKVPVLIDNDVTAFLIAEKETSKLKKYKNIVAVMLGTGLGGAIMTNGRVLYGKNGFAGEIGHIIININGNLRSLEQNTSGSFVPKIAKELIIKNKIETKDLNKNNADTKKIKDHILKSFGIGLANLNLIFNPDVFVLGGSIYKLFLSKNKKNLQAIIKKYSLDGYSPLLIDANKNTSIPKGMVMKFLNKE